MCFHLTNVNWASPTDRYCHWLWDPALNKLHIYLCPRGTTFQLGKTENKESYGKYLVWVEEMCFTEEKPEEGNQETCSVEEVPKEVSLSAGSRGEGGYCKHRDPKEEMFPECVRSNRHLCGQGRVSEEPERPETQQCGMGAQNGGRAVVRSVSQEPPMWAWGIGPKPGNFQMKALRIMKICPFGSRILSLSGSTNLLNSCPCCLSHPVLQPFTILLILLWIWLRVSGLSLCL